MEPTVVYEDQDVIVLNKPSGLLTHPVNREDNSDSVVGWLLRNRPEISEVKDRYAESLGEWADLRPGIVHRLDKETSGIIVAAKNQKAFEYLKGLFKERQLEKTYLALVYGYLKEKSGLIEAPLGKREGKQTTRTRGKHELTEKPATTAYRVVGEYRDYSLVEVKPKTGRMHQIRAHLKHLGHPVVCDRLYAGNRVCPSDLGRLFLHAQKLTFQLPSGSMLTVEADLPSELEQFLAGLAKMQ